MFDKLLRSCAASPARSSARTGRKNVSRRPFDAYDGFPGGRQAHFWRLAKDAATTSVLPSVANNFKFAAAQL